MARIFADSERRTRNEAPRAAPLVATCERLLWILERPIFIYVRVIQPDEDDFLDAMPIAYSGALFRAEIVERAGEEARGNDQSPPAIGS